MKLSKKEREREKKKPTLYVHGTWNPNFENIWQLKLRKNTITIMQTDEERKKFSISYFFSFQYP